MKTYQTTEIARSVGIHSNTVRLYEALGLIPKAKRRPNGYRIFTCFHLEQIRLVRRALSIEVLQNGLRKRIIHVLKAAAAGDLDQALHLAELYLQQLIKEEKNAEEALEIAEQLISGQAKEVTGILLTRKRAAEHLNISMEALRNWERNGLLTVKRKENGYRVYSQDEIRRLKMILALRCANYSLAAILRMLNSLSGNPQVNIRQVLDTPRPDEDIVSACDKLLTSLKQAKKNAVSMLIHLKKMKEQFKTNPTL